MCFCSSRFVFVPGPEDPGPGTVLPRYDDRTSVSSSSHAEPPSFVFEFITFLELMISGWSVNSLSDVRPPLAEHITEEFRQRVPFSVFTTNPCRYMTLWILTDVCIRFCSSSLLLFNGYVRIQYCSQEMVVIREDLVNKMCRNCVRLPSSNLDIPSHVSQRMFS